MSPFNILTKWRPTRARAPYPSFGALETANRELCEKDQELENLRKANYDLRVKTYRSHQHLACVEEQNRQHRELYINCDKQRVAEETRHAQEIRDLYSNINSFQKVLKNITDEECVTHMRKLRQNLDSWIRSNFLNGERLDQLGNFELRALMPHVALDDHFPATSHQRRAAIQAYIVAILNDFIFYPYAVGLARYPHENGFLYWLEQKINEQCSSHVWQNYRFGIGQVLDKVTETYQERGIKEIASLIESEIGRYSSTAVEARNRQLASLLGRCMSFKSELMRQQSIYTFTSTSSGKVFNSNTMIPVGATSSNEATVILSLWPSVSKCAGADSYLLESELVWITESKPK